MSRAHRSLWTLMTATILSAGLLAQALAAPASLTADVVVAVSGLALAISAALLGRAMRYLTRAPASGRVRAPRRYR